MIGIFFPTWNFEDDIFLLFWKQHKTIYSDETLMLMTLDFFDEFFD